MRAVAFVQQERHGEEFPGPSVLDSERAYERLALAGALSSRRRFVGQVDELNLTPVLVHGIDGCEPGVENTGVCIIERDNGPVLVTR